MAIAYFIPDQAKLLAASSAHGSLNNSSSASGGSGGGGGSSASHASSSPTAQPHSPASHNPDGGHTSNATHHNNNHFRANITIPLSAYSATGTNSDVGCWDLLTQIFCHALRFCHESERHPTVIQISLEISSSGPTGATTVQVGAQAAPVQQQAPVPQQTPVQHQLQQQHSENSATSPSLVVHPTALLQNAGTQAQHRNLGEATTAAAGISRNMEPGTHKPPAKRN